MIKKYAKYAVDATLSQPCVLMIHKRARSSQDKCDVFAMTALGNRTQHVHHLESSMGVDVCRSALCKQLFKQVCVDAHAMETSKRPRLANYV